MRAGKAEASNAGDGADAARAGTQGLPERRGVQADGTENAEAGDDRSAG